jgi:hypothetical protein
MINILQQEGIEITPDNRIKFLESGEEKFIDLFEEVKKPSIAYIWNISTSEMTL